MDTIRISTIRWDNWRIAFKCNQNQGHNAFKEMMQFVEMMISSFRRSSGWPEHHWSVQWRCQQVSQVQRLLRDHGQVSQLLRSGCRGQEQELLRQQYLPGSGQCRVPPHLAPGQHPRVGRVSAGQEWWVWSPGHHHLRPGRDLHEWSGQHQPRLQLRTVWLWTQQLQQCEGCWDSEAERGAGGGPEQAAVLGGEHGPGQDCLRRLEEGGGHGQQEGWDCQQREGCGHGQVQLSPERGEFFICGTLPVKFFGRLPSKSVIRNKFSLIIVSAWAVQDGADQTRGWDPQSSSSSSQDHRVESEERHVRGGEGEIRSLLWSLN